MLPIIGESLMIKDLPTKTGSISLIIIPNKSQRTTITDIHAKIDEETCVKGWFVSCLI
jgi:hypothetical protein